MLLESDLIQGPLLVEKFFKIGWVCSLYVSPKEGGGGVQSSQLFFETHASCKGEN